MRVTAGKYKGRKLIDRPFDHIRPTADMVKQAIFNKLAFVTNGAKVLDLFCGTGALGIEALSRGASMVVMADLNPKSVMLTKDNLKLLSTPPEAKVLQGDYKTVLERLKGEKFDIIILDPPYKSGVYENCLQKIHELDLLSNEGIIVCEHNKEDKFDFSLFEIESEKIYGIKCVSYLLKREEI